MSPSKDSNKKGSILRSSVVGGADIGNHSSRGVNYSMTNTGGNPGLLMGKTSLFSRVALSPNQTVGANNDKKSGLLSISKPNNNSSINDNETQASSIVPGKDMAKTVRSNTNSFKDAVQRGVLSGAGILKK